MAKEIERKFLVKGNAWRAQVTNMTCIRQGYIPTIDGTTVRIRIVGRAAYLTLKDHAVGITRHEYEYCIPFRDARAMLDNLCVYQIEKRRHVIPIRGAKFKWEVDEFLGANASLVTAEIELPSEDTSFPHPIWLGKDVTTDRRYKNNNLAAKPFGKWNFHRKNAGGKK